MNFWTFEFLSQSLSKCSLKIIKSKIEISKFLLRTPSEDKSSHFKYVLMKITINRSTFENNNCINKHVLFDVVMRPNDVGRDAKNLWMKTSTMMNVKVQWWRYFTYFNGYWFTFFRIHLMRYGRDLPRDLLVAIFERMKTLPILLNEDEISSLFATLSYDEINQ